MEKTNTARDVACPECGQPAGSWCRGLSRNSHGRRVGAWRWSKSKKPSRGTMTARLLAEIGDLRAALQPFARMADGKDEWRDADGACGVFPTLAMVRHARDVFRRTGPGART